MPCEIHSLQDLYDCLHRAVTGTPPNQRLALSGELFAEAGELVSHLGLSSLELAQRAGDMQDMVQLEPDHVEVKATAVLLPDGPGRYSYDVELAGTYPGKPALLLRGTPSATVTNWTFAGNFAGRFPDYYGAKGAKLAWLPSFLPGAVFGDPAFRVATAAATPPAGLRFEGKLDLRSGSLEQLKAYFSSDLLPIGGPVTVRRGTYPLVELEADPGYSIPKLAEISMDVAVRDEKPPSTDLELVGRPTLAGFDELEITSPLLQSPYAWVFTAQSLDPEKYSLKGGLDALSKFAGGPPLALPSGFDSLASMYLESVSVGFAPSKTPKIDLVSFRIATPKANKTLWGAPILGLALDGLAVEWDIVGLSGSDPSMLGTMTGTLVVEPARLDASVSLSGLDTSFAPDVQFSVALDPKTRLPVASLFKAFTSLELDIPLDITDLRLEGSTGSRTLQFVAALEPTWPLRVPVTIDEVTFAFLYAPNSFTGTLGLRVTLFKLGFIVGAAFRGEGKGWLLSGGLLPESQGTSLDTVLHEVAPGYFPDELPANLGKIELRQLSTSFDTTSSLFSFEGALGWPFELLGLDVDIEAALSLSKEPSKPPAGWVQGALTIDSLSLAARYAFGVEGNETIAFELGWRGATLTCIYGHNDKGESTLRANLGGVSFGDIVAWLAGLGGEQVTLAAPWDALYRIRFDDLWLAVNLHTKEVGVSYEVGLDLGVAKIDSVGLSYARRAGSPSLDIEIAGSFVGVEYPAGDPLSWDLLNDPPPAPPGKAEALLDLRYLGLGQNVGFRETKAFHRVADVIEALEADFKPVDEKDNPLASLATLKFTGDGNWLIGADFTVMSAVSIAGVFADPSLYGIRIGLQGARVKSLAGLEFEILYRKVTETVGVYHIELTLPEAMRQIQIPPVAVTVPTIVIDVYTNGNFRLDFGFPWGGDWERSFCIQGGPFIGYGGFYFALLDGSTSEKLPAVTNGTFAPVIEFGLGLQVGLGRTFNKGVLKAGATITVQGIVEGVLAWFNPAERSSGTEVYYWIQGTVAVVGKVYGEVDFVVVKASVSITATASVTMTVEAHQPVEVQLVVSVEVSASIQIVFVTINFSFSTSLDLSFSIGEASTPPWRVTTASVRDHPLQLLAQRSSHRVRTPSAAELLRAASPAGPRAAMDWSPRRVLEGRQTADVNVMLVPVLTPAIGPTGGSPATQIVMSLVVPTSTTARALHADEVLRVDHEAPGEVAFNVLAGGVLRWAIGALGDRRDGESVTIDELEAIACFLADRENRDATFTYERVTGLIEQNFRLRISNPIGPTGGLFDPGSDRPRSAAAPNVQGAAFPMIPEITMAPQGRPAIDFWSHSCANDDYRAFLETYYEQLRIDPENGIPTDPFAPSPCEDGPVGLASGSGPVRRSQLPPGCAQGLHPVSSIVFCDWFALIAQQSVQLAADMLRAYPYRPSGGESLRQIVGSFGAVTVAYRTRVGDTPGTIAAAFGRVPEELHAANPWLGAAGERERLPAGSTVHVGVGPTVRAVAKANADYPLKVGARMTIGGVRHLISAGDTLGSIAKAFGIADLAKLFVGAAVDANDTNASLLRAGGTLAVPAAQRVVLEADLPYADALDRIAASYFIRARGWTMDATARDHVAWYVAAIGQLNPAFAGTVTVPIAQLQDGRIVDTGNRTTYPLKDGDTPANVAATFALLQLHPDYGPYRTFRAQVTVNPPPPLRAGSVVSMPACKLPVRAGDTFASVAAALLIAGPSDIDPLLGALAALARANAGADVLAPRAVLALPTIEYPIAAGDTIGSLAQRFALSVEELADSIAGDQGILAPYDGTTTFTVPDVATRKVEQLVADLVAFGSFNSLSTTASRFLLAGMRAPVPGPTGAPQPGLRGLYEVVGQQIPGPTATGATYKIGFKNAGGATWFCFEPPPGSRAGGDCANELTVSLSPDFLRRNAPGPTLEPLTVTGPIPMQLYDLVPPSYAMEHAIPWQPASSVPLPGPSGPSGPVSGVGGTPTVWMFPPALLSRLRTSGPAGPTAVTPPYELLATRAGAGAGATGRPLERYCWATAIPLTVSRALDDSGGIVPGAYEVVGVGESARELLLEAWTATTAAPSPRDRLYLLHVAGTAGPNDEGLVSDALSSADSFLLRTNLSTETHSGALGAAAGSGRYFARIAAIGPFLEEVWEATVTGSGGFHFVYADAAGQGLPDELFASDGTAQLTALLLLDRQSRPTSPERGLLRFNNCAVVGEGLDAAATSLAATLVDPTPADLRRAASVQPGMVGFGLARRNPHGATGPQDLTRRLHSLVGYQVGASGQDFGPSHESLPLGPVDDAPGWLRLPPAPPHAYWSYHQVVPIAQFGRYNACPDSPALPRAQHNPYAGITGPVGPVQRALSRASLDLAYHDVYGNTTKATQPAGRVDVTVGYTDEVIGVSAWPGAALTYLFEPGPALSTTLSLQIDRYLPGAGNAFEAAVRAANADGERYGALFYQVQQRDVTFALGSNLGTAAADPAELRAAMTAFVTKAKVYADTAVTLRQRTTRPAQNETLAGLADRLSVTVEMLLDANSGVDAAALFPATYVKPHIVAAPAMNTLAALADQVVGRAGLPVTCAAVTQPDPTCTGPGGLLVGDAVPASARGPEDVSSATPADVATANDEQPLTPGKVLRTIGRTSGPLPAERTSLNAAARWLGCSVFADVVDPARPDGPPIEVGLVAENWTASPLIANGVKLEIAGVAVETKDDTLRSIYEKVSPLGHQPQLARGDFAAALADVPGLLIAGKTLAYATLLVPQPPPPTGPAPAQPRFSLADAVAAGAGTIAQLAELNRAVASFFHAGSPLLLGYSCCKGGPSSTPARLARDAAVTLAQLARLNATTPVGTSVEMTVPEVTFLPDPSSCWAPFAPGDADSLATIATAVGAAPRAVADVNRQLPGIFRTGATVTVGGRRVTAAADDSLETVFARSGASGWDAFVSALGEGVNAGIYRRAGVVVTPLPVVPGDSPALEELAARLHVDGTALLTANRTQEGFLKVGAKVRGPAPAKAPPPEVEVRQFDTVLSLIRRLRAAGSDVTIDSLIEANRGRRGLVTGGARVVLPPVPTSFAAPFTPVLPPAGSEGEAKIVFGVEAWIEIARAPGLIHPDFRETAAVHRARSPLAPRIGAESDRRLALRAFASSFEQAFAAQPLKCAVATEEAGSGSRATRIWAVNFGAQGISRFAVDASRPAFYALEPLSTSPWSGQLSYPAYVSGKGLCAEVKRRVQSVDVDAWMRDLLATIDLALTPGYAVPAFRMAATGGVAGLGQGDAAVGAARDAVDALRAPTPEPSPPDPLSGPMGLVSAARRSRPALASLPIAATGCTGPTANGPADYERLVGAKETIAGALRRRVAPIVDAPGATGPYQVEWASSALHQQALVRLGEAYGISAIVQLPCDVSSPMVTPPPGASGPAPPRASGKVVPSLYTIPAGAPAVVPPPTSLTAVAAHYGVSAPFLAQVLGGTQGILEPDAVIAGVTVGDHGTIDGVAREVGVPTDPTAPGYWELWSPFVTGFADRDVLQPGASVPLSSLSRAVSSGESLTAIGEFFARDAGSVGRANQARPGIVRPGEVRVAGYPAPYPATAADTLVTVAQGLSERNPSKPVLTMSELFRLLADEPGFLQPGASLSMVELLPGMSISTSKVSLGPVARPSGPPPPLTFLLTVKQEAEHATVLLNLDYAINELEYGIRSVPNAGSYQASSWLTFVLPLDGSQGGADSGAKTSIPQIQIPIPLRAYPPPSVLSGQSGIASDPGSELPARAREWDYRFDVRTRKAAQDTDHLRVLFGERGTAAELDAASYALMRWLGAFVEASPALKDDLARLPRLSAGAHDANAAYAVQALSVIAEEVGRALAAGPRFAAAGATAAQTYAYQMTTLTNGDELATLRLTPEPPGPTGPSAVWPAVYIQSPTAPTGGTGPDAGYLPLGGAGGVYYYPGGFLAADQQTYRFRFEKRDVIRNRTGRGAIAVTRNDRLIARGPLGPTGSPAPVPTVEGFVYRTPYAQFVDPLIPLIDADAAIDVARLGSGPLPRALGQHILNVVRAATDVAPGALAEPANIELSAAYGFLVGGDLLVKTPVCLVPWREVDDGDVGTFAQQLAATLGRWRRDADVDEQTGLLAFQLSVFADQPPSSGASGPGRRPILRFTDLRLHMPDIVWPPTEEHQ